MTPTSYGRRAAARTLLACCAAGALGACSGPPPGAAHATEWRPGGVNEINLAAMVADPADLVRGQRGPGADGPEAAAAVLRLRAGTVKPLPDSGLAEVHLQSNGDAAQQAAPSGGN